MNQHDSQRIAQVLKGAGYALTDAAENADLVLLNTCSVRDKAEQKVYSALGRWRELKVRNSAVIIGVGGCVAQQEGEKLLRRVRHLDLVFGPHNIHRLPKMVEDAEKDGSRSVEIDFYRDPSYMEDLHGPPEVKGPKAFVTIMEGCNKVCSFCIVPYTRGREISRSSESILAEIRGLVFQGVREVMLLGQNVNSYGKGAAGESTFPELLRRINEIRGLERIRFTTSHPQDLSPGLVEAYATLQKLCEHLHLPVQSGSDRVLRRMRRGYTREEYLARLRQLRGRRPEIALSSDIIVGFPGETDDDFEDTLAILREVEYDELFAFAYSRRPHTAAAKMYQDDVSTEVKKERLKAVQELQSQISLRKNTARVHTTQQILVEGLSKLGDGQIMGRTKSNRIVNVKGGEQLTGQLIQVHITAATANSLIGELPAEMI
jgi:tRNA-2-methylthio-N6-dimethylallyladenosine synthase